MKARLCAFLLWQARDNEKLELLKADAVYGHADAKQAMWEGFRRESAVAMELIVKGVLAKQMELRHAPPVERVPANHDIPELWATAGLPDLPVEDQYRLLIFKSVLLWSGRYATPRSAKAWSDENRAFNQLDPSERDGKLVIKFPITYGWAEFDRLYQMADAKLQAISVNDAHHSSQSPDLR